MSSQISYWITMTWLAHCPIFSEHCHNNKPNWSTQHRRQLFGWQPERVPRWGGHMAFWSFLRKGKLRLFDVEGESIWFVSTSNKASRAVILDSGNILMLSDCNKLEMDIWSIGKDPYIILFVYTCKKSRTNITDLSTQMVAIEA